MAITTFTEGETLRLTYSIFDTAGDPLDADGTVTVVVKPYQGAAVAYVLGVDAEVTQVSTGVYRFEAFGLAAGRYRAEWQAVGTVVNDREETDFRIWQDLEAA